MVDSKELITRMRELANYFEARDIEPRDAVMILAAMFVLLLDFNESDETVAHEIITKAWRMVKNRKPKDEWPDA